SRETIPAFDSTDSLGSKVSVAPKKLLLGRRLGLPTRAVFSGIAACMVCPQLDDKRRWRPGRRNGRTWWESSGGAAGAKSAVASLPSRPGARYRGVLKQWKRSPFSARMRGLETDLRVFPWRSTFCGRLLRPAGWSRAYPHIPELATNNGRHFWASRHTFLNAVTRNHAKKVEFQKNAWSTAFFRPPYAAENSRAFSITIAGVKGQCPGLAHSDLHNGPWNKADIRSRSIALGLGFTGLDAFTAPPQGVLISSLAVSRPDWSFG
ncbi:hypothetical protein CFAM422_005770, partial [Trichoderma lentiforme]